MDDKLIEMFMLYYYIVQLPRYVNVNNAPVTFLVNHYSLC